MLARSGKTVGLYSSPHLWHFAERIQVSGLRIDDAYLVSVLESLEKDLPSDVFQALSFFEVTTLLAFRAFKESKVDIVVLEVGLGGRFDATNVADPVMSIITSIALDHQQYLGPTTKDIAREKAGIMRPGRPVFWGGLGAGDPDSDRVIRKAAESLGSPLICEGEHFGWREGKLFVDLFGSGSSSQSSPVSASVRSSAKVWPEEALPQEIKRAPPFLRSNFSKAVAAYCHLMHQNLAPGDLDALIANWDSAPYRKAPSRYGRFHAHWGAPNGFKPRSIILDVGHNPAGAQAFVEGLRAAGLLSHGPLPGLVSILGDKDIGGILDVLRPVLHPLLVFASSSERSLNQEMVPSQHRDLAFFSDFSRAWQVLDQGQPDDRPWVITGSVHAIGDVFQVLSIDPLSDT
jgi:dihydrofolate synthase/folylpolyglutamate synthase